MDRTRNGLSWKEASLLAAKRNEEKYQKRISDYNLNPMLCFFCKEPIPYEKRRNKFCGHSCSASFNNLGIVRNFKERTYEEYIKEKDNRNNYAKKSCLCCGEETSNFKFCSQKCHIIHKRNIRREKILVTGKLISHTKDKWYLIEVRGHKCERCSTEKWMKEPVPLDTHHKDGNNDNNYLDNLLLICPNCHRQTDNHGSKNKTNSKRKQYRKRRYDQGLSY